MKTRIAFVLLASPLPPEPAALAAALAEMGAATPNAVAVEGEDGDSALTLRFDDGATVFLPLIPTPIPKREAEEAAGFSVGPPGWTPARHAAHLVTVLQHPEMDPAVERLTLLTRILAATVLTTDALGVYWGDAGATHEARFFVELARAPGLPMPLWSGVAAQRTAGERLQLLSLGMAQLELPEVLLELPRDQGADGVRFLYDLCLYMAERGEPIAAGDTIGRTAEERLRASYVASPIPDRDPVLAVDIPSLIGPRPGAV